MSSEQEATEFLQQVNAEFPREPTVEEFLLWVQLTATGLSAQAMAQAHHPDPGYDESLPYQAEAALTLATQPQRMVDLVSWLYETTYQQTVPPGGGFPTLDAQEEARRNASGWNNLANELIEFYEAQGIRLYRPPLSSSRPQVLRNLLHR